MKHMSRPKSSAVKDIDIDIADILGQKYRYRINIDKGYINPPLVWMPTFPRRQLKSQSSTIRLRVQHLISLPPILNAEHTHTDDLLANHIKT